MPLDALTQARIRSLEIVVAWLIGRVYKVDEDPDFTKAILDNTYILELAEKITEAQDG